MNLQQNNQLMNMEKILNCQCYPFCLVLETGGRIELIAPSYQVFLEWTNGINMLVRFKKQLSYLQSHIEIVKI